MTNLGHKNHVGGNYDSRTRLAVTGFTVIEILMALAIMSIAFGTIYKSFHQINRSYTTENVKAGVQQGARIAVEFMVHDIRLAGLNPLGSADAGIHTDVPLHTSNMIRIRSDVNYDGQIVETDPFEDITYELDGTQLVQENRTERLPMLDNVTALNFTFLDVDDNPATTHDAIRSVVVSLTMEKPAGPNRTVSRTYTTTVRCRNL